MRPTMRATPTMTPTTIPAMSPPESPLLMGLVVEPFGPPPVFGDRGLSVLDHVDSQLGGFTAGLKVMSVTAMSFTLAGKKSGPGACAKKRVEVFQF